MNAQRVMRQLRREVKANPKRAALLAVLVAVGIYFWAPLIAGWVMPEGKGIVAASPPKANSATSPAAPPTGQSATGTPKPSTTTPWTTLWAAIQEDNRMKPATALVAATDPFRPFPPPPEPESVATNDDANAANETAETKRSTSPHATTAGEVTPKSLGMKLTGTAIGARLRSAVIDGKIVFEGDPISPTAGDGKQNKTPDAAKVTFRLTRVEPDAIVLERDAKKYTLTIETPPIEGAELTPIPPKAL